MKFYKVFDYVQELNCFVVNPLFKEVMDYLGIKEWNEVVWIGRYFTFDNDYGEHWFDNWDEREQLEEAAAKIGYKPEFLMVINPDRFQNGKDGPCHTAEERKSFWSDVCRCLTLSLETIAAEARRQNERNKSNDYLTDLEDRIEKVLNK